MPGGPQPVPAGPGGLSQGQQPILNVRISPQLPILCSQ
jgi:hypothetical protein